MLKRTISQVLRKGNKIWFLTQIINYVANQKYPEGMSRDQKKEFRRKCKCYTIEDGVLYYVGFGKKGKKHI